MPHITVSMYPGRDTATKKALAEKLCLLTCEELGIDRKVVSVSVQDVPPEDWEQLLAKIPAQTVLVKPGE